MFDLRALRYFVAAYEERSITGAAKRCHIAQPSVSTAVQSLEESLGTRLFARTKSGLSPTHDGDKLYPRARALLAESAAILHSFRQPPARELRLRIQADMLVRCAAPLISLLCEHLPGVRLRFSDDDEACDLRLVSAHCRRDDEWHLDLWEEDYVAAIPGTSELRFRQQVDVGDLHGVPYIERPYCVFSDTYNRLLEARQIKPDVRARVVREEELLELLELGVGVAMVPRSHCAGLRNAIIKPLSGEEAVKRRVVLACPAADIEMIRLLQSMKPALLDGYKHLVPARKARSGTLR
ncbi:MAG TPA: LysR family transcriptional regulator [Noviherbaspirillum sp.]|jgi:DNA-binding transcriptional LysR family regulator|uniref:LysR family transcriptional regulator n=1 Tax=Noviherbaspirillum sp. TaxID=1926288 RepID=UPI002F9417CD